MCWMQIRSFPSNYVERHSSPVVPPPVPTAAGNGTAAATAATPAAAATATAIPIAVSATAVAAANAAPRGRQTRNTGLSSPRRRATMAGGHAPMGSGSLSSPVSPPAPVSVLRRPSPRKGISARWGSTSPRATVQRSASPVPAVSLPPPPPPPQAAIPPAITPPIPKVTPAEVAPVIKAVPQGQSRAAGAARGEHPPAAVPSAVQQSAARLLDGAKAFMGKTMIQPVHGTGPTG